MNTHNDNTEPEDEIIIDSEDLSEDQSDTTHETIVDENETTSDREKKLKTKLDTCVAEKQEYLDGWQRANADFVNFKKRTEADKKNVMQYAIEDFVNELIPTLDNFDMAFKDKAAWEAAPETWRKGIEYIYQQLLQTLESRNISRYEPQGEDFDESKHHSIETVDGEENKVITVVRAGYKMGDKVLRVPQVTVGNGIK